MATCEKLDNNRARLTIHISAEMFANALQQAYIKGVKHFNVPGFRKGKAPRKVVENLYGPQVFYEDAFEAVWGDAYDAALLEHELTAVDKPSIDIEKISAEDGVDFTAEVQLKPEVTLGDYKGIEVPEPTYTVEDKDVDAELDKEREKNARFVDVERAAEKGDRVVLDYSGSVDGEKFDGGTAEEQVLVLGSSTFIPGFEDQLIGMKAGESKDITVTFPTDYAEHLAGKEAVFAVSIKAVQIKELPALDDEFAKDVSEFDTLDALKADKKAKMTEQADKNRQTAIENLAIKAVCDNAAVDIPQVMIDRQVNYMLQDVAYRLQMSGLSLDDYCNYTGTTVDKMRDEFKADAATRVKMQLVIEAVGKAEDIAATDEEIDAEAKKLAEQNNMSVEDFEKQISDDDRDYLADRITAEKTVKFVVDHCKLVPAPAEDAKAEAKPKKTRAKAKKETAAEPEA